jgi:hypothetical protein
MPNGQAVEDLTMELPLGQETVHEGDETGVVLGFQEMNHLVDDDVFEAFTGFFGQIGVEADGADSGNHLEHSRPGGSEREPDR